MSRRLLTAAAILVWSLAPSFVREARAQEPVTSMQLDLVPVVARALAAAAPAPAPALRAAATTQFSAPSLPARMRVPHSGSALMLSLYATTAGVQMMDVRSTLTAFKVGATEANPLMSGIVKNTAAFVAFKAGIAAGAIFSAHSMAKHNKVRAIVTLALVNSAYAMVVAHNYQVAHSYSSR